MTADEALETHDIRVKRGFTSEMEDALADEVRRLRNEVASNPLLRSTLETLNARVAELERENAERATAMNRMAGDHALEVAFKEGCKVSPDDYTTEEDAWLASATKARLEGR